MNVTSQRLWAHNSERLQIHLGIDGDAQESSFMNATLQRARDLEFSVATHVEIPPFIQTEEGLAGWLGLIFEEFLYEHPEVSIEIQLGPAVDSQNPEKDCFACGGPVSECDCGGEGSDPLDFDEGAEGENAARELGEEE